MCSQRRRRGRTTKYTLLNFVWVTAISITLIRLLCAGTSQVRFRLHSGRLPHGGQQVAVGDSGRGRGQGAVLPDRAGRQRADSGVHCRRPQRVQRGRQEDRA